MAPNAPRDRVIGKEAVREIASSFSTVLRPTNWKPTTPFGSSLAVIVTVAMLGSSTTQFRLELNISIWNDSDTSGSLSSVMGIEMLVVPVLGANVAVPLVTTG